MFHRIAIEVSVLKKAEGLEIMEGRNAIAINTYVSLYTEQVVRWSKVLF